MTEHMAEATKVLLDGIENVKDQTDAIGLVGKLMHANLMDYQGTTNMLIEGYQRQISDLEAELKAVRLGINQLFASDYMPTESAIIRAVFNPTRQLIEDCRRAQSGNR